MEIDIKQIRELLRAMKQFDASELEIESDGRRLYLQRGQTNSSMPPSGAVSQTIPPPPGPISFESVRPPPGPVVEPEDDPSVIYITSPFVGTFYRSPSPDAGPFVTAGQRIVPGTVLCIVEAMKLMNEIESEVSGTILDVLVETGKPVEYGDHLFKIKKSG